MLTISNILSFSRAPLALLFLYKSVSIRIAATILAMLTDSIDGYFARKTKSTTKFGAIFPTWGKVTILYSHNYTAVPPTNTTETDHTTLTLNEGDSVFLGIVLGDPSLDDKFGLIGCRRLLIKEN